MSLVRYFFVIFLLALNFSYSSFAQDASDAKKEAMAYLQQGGVAYIQENYQEAADFYLKFVMAQKTKNPNPDAMALFQEGSLAYMQGNYLAAADLYLQAGMIIGKTVSSRPPKPSTSKPPSSTTSKPLTSSTSKPPTKAPTIVPRTIAEVYKQGERHYFGDNGKSVNYGEAFKWLKMASDAGHENATNILWVMYENGKGVPQNGTEAIRYLTKAAELGHAKSQGLLGVFYFEGHRLPKNLQKSFVFHKLAADQNLALSQRYLGVLFVDKSLYQDDEFIHNLYPDEVVTFDKARLRRFGMNYTEALIYTALATMQGDEIAKKAIVEFVKIFGQEQVLKWAQGGDQRNTEIKARVAQKKRDKEKKYKKIIN